MWTLETSTGKRIALTRLPAMVGSAADADITLAHESIDPIHAALSDTEDGRLQVAAIGDAVIGIEGARVERGSLAAGEQLVIGVIAFTVHHAGAAAPIEPQLATRRRPSATRPSPASMPTARVTAGAGRRGTALQFNAYEKRRGLIHTDFSQLDIWGKLVALLILLALVALLGWGISVGIASLM